MHVGNATSGCVNFLAFFEESFFFRSLIHFQGGAIELGSLL